MNDSAASFKSKLLFNARIIDPDQNTDEHGGLLIIDNKIAAIGKNASYQAPDDAVRIDCHGNVVAPGLVDMMVFTGEPGAEHKETLATASAAAIAGGVTTIITMPDTRPVIDDSALVDFIKRRAKVVEEAIKRCWSNIFTAI